MGTGWDDPAPPRPPSIPPLVRGSPVCLRNLIDMGGDRWRWRAISCARTGRQYFCVRACARREIPQALTVGHGAERLLDNHYSPLASVVVGTVCEGIDYTELRW